MNTIIYVLIGVVSLVALALLFTRLDHFRDRKQKRMLDKIRRPLPLLSNTVKK
jgi:hypothetical protein